MSCLCSLQLAFLSCLLDASSEPSTPKDVVTLSKLTFFRYIANNMLFLEALVAGYPAPSLWDVEIHNYDGIWPPLVVHLPRFISEIEEHYHVVHVVIKTWDFHLSLSAQSGYISHWKPGFKFDTIPICPPESITRMSAALSTRLATVGELHVTFEGESTDVWEDLIPWHRFLQQLPSVKVLRTEGENNYRIARILLQGHEDPDDDVAVLPALEEIEFEEIQKNSSPTDESQCEPELAALDAFIFARQQVGCPVEVSSAISWTSRRTNSCGSIESGLQACFKLRFIQGKFGECRVFGGRVEHHLWQRASGHGCSTCSYLVDGV